MIALFSRKKFKRILDALSLGAVLQYVAYRYFQSTMFTIYYSETYKLITMFLLVVFGGSRFCFFVCSQIAIADKKTKKQLFIKLLLCALLSLPFIYVGWRQDYKMN